MFTLVNTWTGHHWGKPGVLREAALGMQLRLLLHLLEGKREATSPLKCSIPEGILPSFPLQRATHSSCWVWGCPVQAEYTVGNQAPALKTAEVSMCSIALHFMPERNIPLGQAKARETMKAFLPPAEYFLNTEVPRANSLLVYSPTSLLGQDYWPKWQQFALQTPWLF